MARSDRIGRYQLLDKLGSGGMADIYRAKLSGAHGFEKTLVIKCLLPSLSDRAEHVDMFITEARIMAQLQHPNVVQVLDFGEADGRYFLAMEYVEGMDLKQLLALCVRRRRRPPTAVAVHVIIEVLKALDYAHRRVGEDGQPLQIVHRDISPSNIFISHLGEVKLSDFGIAKATTRTEHSQVGEIKGKYGYVAPEMISGEDVGARADIFSTGVVLAELLIVRRLFLGQTDLDTVLLIRDVKLDRLHKYGDHIPKELKQVIQSSLERDPATRYQDCATFRDALRRFLFNRQLLVQDTDLLAFVESLQAESGTRPLSPTPTPTPAVTNTPTAPLPPRDMPSGEGAYAVMRPRADRQPTPPAARLSQPTIPDPPEVNVPAPEPLVSEPRIQRPADADMTASLGPQALVGRRRRITLRPPPKPTPLSVHMPHTGDYGSISPDHAAAVERESASARQKIDLTEELRAMKAEEVDLTVLAASRVSQTAYPATADREGDIEQTSLFRLTYAMALAEETGLIALRHDQVIKEVYLVDGDPVHVSSNQPEELFGQYLKRKGVITEQQLNLAAGMLRYFRGRLGDSLVGLQLLSAIEVAQHLTAQVREKLIEVFLWERGSYSFYAGKTSKYESAPLGWDAFELLGSAARALPPDAIGRRIDRYLDATPSADPSSGVPPEVFRIGATPRRLLEKLDGKVSCRQLLDAGGSDDRWLATARALYLLIEVGLVTV